MGSAPRHDNHRGLRVLVVEDDPDTAQSTAFLLGVWGHQVQVCLDGRKCVPVAEAFRPDVILLDIGLPGADGYEVAKRVRARLTRRTRCGSSPSPGSGWRRPAAVEGSR
jgi:two-component system CheB/CheR fusion protein